MLFKGLLFLAIIIAFDLSVLAQENVKDLQEFPINDSTTLRDVKTMVFTKLKEFEATQSTVLAKLKQLEATLSTVSTTLRDVKATQSMVFTALNHFTVKYEDSCSRLLTPKNPKDCADLWKSGVRDSGVYRIWPVALKPAENFEVYCDMTSEGGGWTVFQKRGQYGNPIDYFYRDWKDFREGFGDLREEFWLGNEKLFTLTNQDSYQLLVNVWDINFNRLYAKYSYFKVLSESENYRLRINGYAGDASDSMSSDNDMMFTTKDRDNDLWPGNCADYLRGAWWHNNCGRANLNGLNLRGNDSYHGIFWYNWKKNHYSMAASEMKIRPTAF